MQSTRVLIVDDDARFRKRVREFLASEATVEIIGEACDGQEAIRKARKLRPDLVLVDIRMPGMNGLEVTRHLKAEMPAVTIIVLTIFDQQEYRDASVASGASAFILKRNMQTELPPKLSALGLVPSRS